jgi:hypothetical protein
VDVGGSRVGTATSRFFSRDRPYLSFHHLRNHECAMYFLQHRGSHIGGVLPKRRMDLRTLPSAEEGFPRSCPRKQRRAFFVSRIT